MQVALSAMPAQLPPITVVIPCYNEAAYLPGALEKLYRQLGAIDAPITVLIAENGSTDGTAEAVEHLQPRYENLKLLRLPTPDYGAAMRDGFLHATTEWVANFDIDYFSGSFLAEALAQHDSADIILASKRDPASDDQRDWIRRRATWAFNLLLKLALRSNVSDTHGMKVIRRSVIEDVAPHVVMTKDLFDTELVIRAERSGYRITEIPVTVTEDRPSKETIWQRIPRTIKGIWRIRKAL